MEFVQPIRDIDEIETIKTYLKQKNERDYIMFMCGINLGLRISDILKLRVGDVRKEYVTIRETKTGKKKIIPINRTLRKALKSYIANKPDEEMLIKSREGKNKAIDRSTAYRILSDAGKQIGMTNIGTHSMRKTFGYHFYQRERDVAALQKIFNHDDQEVTLRYIGVEQDYLNKAVLRHGL